MKEEKCHFIGIGGVGMSGLARLLLDKQVAVSGSDLSTNGYLEKLSRKGADVYVGHNSSHITSDMTVIYSSGISQDNPEYITAKNLNCSILHRSDLLNKLTQGFMELSVVGMHGKTTTAALLATVLKEAGLDPAFAVGGTLVQYGTNAASGKGDYFVVEGDESDGSFLKLSSYGAIITNIGRDHMDYFGSKEKIIESFETFIKNVASPKHLFWCGDNMYLQQIKPNGISYGFCEECRLRALNFEQNGWKICFDISFEDKLYRNIELPLIGAHNALNALAVFGLALSLGVAEEKIRAAFSNFKGIARRCEVKGEEGGVLVIDDYAHHPTEIAGTLYALKEAAQNRRLLVVYQPHRYSRIRDCCGSFGNLFDSVDELLVTEIYSAGERAIDGISHETIIEEVEQSSETTCRHAPLVDVIDILEKIVLPGDVVATLGAGTVTSLGSELLERLKSR